MITEIARRTLESHTHADEKQINARTTDKGGLRTKT